MNYSARRYQEPQESFASHQQRPSFGTHLPVVYKNKEIRRNELIHWEKRHTIVGSYSGVNAECTNWFVTLVLPTPPSPTMTIWYSRRKLGSDKGMVRGLGRTSVLFFFAIACDWDVFLEKRERLYGIRSTKKHSPLPAWVFLTLPLIRFQKTKSFIVHRRLSGHLRTYWWKTNRASDGGRARPFLSKSADSSWAKSLDALDHRREGILPIHPFRTSALWADCICKMWIEYQEIEITSFRI